MYSKRKRQAEARLRSVVAGDLPRRDQHVLDFGSDSEVESEVKEAIYISETESEVEQEPTEPKGVRADFRTSLDQPISTNPRASSSRAAPPDDSRASRIRNASVSANNPSLRKPKAPPAPTIDHKFLKRKGVICNPPIEHPLEGLVVSIDWHQVLDTIRTKFKTLRLADSWWYYLLDPVKDRLTELRAVAEAIGQPIKIIVLSYTHTPALRDKVKAGSSQ